MRLRFPHPLVLLVAFTLVAAIASWILPAGQFERQLDETTGRETVVPGTYHAVEPNPVTAFQTAVAIPRGMVDAGAVVFFVFLVGGSFAVVERTGALERAVNWLVAKLQRREQLVIPICCIAFGAAGALMQMAEELLAFIPVLLLLTRRLGFDRLTAVAMSMGASAVCAAFSPIDPFMAGIAMQVAGLPPLAGAGFRLAFLLLALFFWTWSLMRHARETRTTPEHTGIAEPVSLGWRHGFILALVLATFAMLVIGVKQFEWGFEQLSALFLVMGVLAGLVGGLKLNGTADALVDGFRTMAFAALLIGFARAIFVVLDHGRIIDTIVHGLVQPIADLPVAISAFGMMVAQTLIHFPVPSTSGQAVLTLPVLVPLSDLIGLSRQVTVLAYQYGAGLCELITPTNGALMAMLAGAGVTYPGWLRFYLPRYAALVGLAIIAMLVAIAIGIG